MKRFLKITGVLFLLLCIILSVAALLNLQDRHPEYENNLTVLNDSSSGLKAGFAALPITPKESLWMAGFGNNRPAEGIHDDTWSRVMVIDDSNSRLAIVALDVIGFMHDDVVDVRKMLAVELGLTYTIIAATHTHEGPDLMGLWGKTPFRSGVNEEYMKFVKKQIVKSIELAVTNLRPARLEISMDLTGAIPQVKDTRMPKVFDSGLRFIRATDKENDTTLGCVLSWGNHPETLWSGNRLVSSDFPHFFREGVEKGVFSGDSLVKSGIGGTALFLNGAIGGLMTTHPSHPISDPFTGKDILEPSFEKVAAQGNSLSILALNAMDQPSDIIEEGAISLVTRTLYLPIKNRLFQLAAALGVLHRGTAGWMQLRTEISAVTLGPISIVTIPGEIYPEIINGGVEAPHGNDFDIAPMEVPAVREKMPGKYKFVIALANDEIGYIIPKSQWDTKAPYTYGREKAPYGEINSLGPDTAPVIYHHLLEILEELGR